MATAGEEEEEEEAACGPCPRDQQGAPPLFYMKPEQNSNTCFPRCSYRHTREGAAETPPAVPVKLPGSPGTPSPRAPSAEPPPEPAPRAPQSPALQPASAARGPRFRIATETMTNRVIRSSGRLSSSARGGGSGRRVCRRHAATHNLEVNPILRTPTPDLRAPAGREHTWSVQRVGWEGHGCQGTSSKPPRARQPAAKRCECSAHTLPTHFAFAPSQQPETEKKAKPVP